jgi:hypothetical protein
MAFIITCDGKRVSVDTELNTFSRNCVLYADDAHLRKCYILNLYKGRHGCGLPGATANYPELIGQKEYWDNPPTHDEIMYQMWHHGLSRYDLATIEEGYILDWKDEEWDRIAEEEKKRDEERADFSMAEDPNMVRQE